MTDQKEKLHLTEADPNASGAPKRRLTGLVMLCIALIGAGIWAFAEIADEVNEGDTRQFDEWAIVALRTPGDLHDPIGPEWFEVMARDCTALGGVGFLTLITLLVVIYLVLRKRYQLALLVLVSIITGMLASTLLKEFFDRARPDLVPHGTKVSSSSFPSGHSMMSALCFLTLGALLANMRRERDLKIFFLSVSIFLTVLVGMSRIYLGVHYPTDVLAGWLAGAVWATLFVGLARYFRIS